MEALTLIKLWKFYCVNPNAFIDNNINYLKLNAQLIIPKNISELALQLMKQRNHTNKRILG